MDKRVNGYPTEIKAQVLADMLSGMSERAAAKKYGVSRESVQKWMLQHVALDRTSPQKRLELEQRQELMLHVYYDAIERIVEITTDGEWLRRQTAEGLAVFSGVLADKATLLTLLRERIARQRALTAGQPSSAVVIDV